MLWCGDRESVCYGVVIGRVCYGVVIGSECYSVV